MKTISVEMNRAVELGNFPPRNLATRQNRVPNPVRPVLTPALRDHLAHPAHRAQPMWLPAPQYKSSSAPHAGCAQVRRAKNSSWIQISGQNFTPAERAMYGLLVLASVGGVAYGLTCLLDLVQNWAQFTLGVAHFTH